MAEPKLEGPIGFHAMLVWNTILFFVNRPLTTALEPATPRVTCALERNAADDQLVLVLKRLDGAASNDPTNLGLHQVVMALYAAGVEKVMIDGQQELIVELKDASDCSKVNQAFRQALTDLGYNEVTDLSMATVAEFRKNLEQRAGQIVANRVLDGFVKEFGSKPEA